MMRASVWTAAITAAIAICGCGDNAESPDPDALVTDPATVSLEIGQRADVAASYLKNGAAYDATGLEFASTEITWDSSNAKLAVVEADGAAATITATGTGTATITATSAERPYSKGTLSATIKVIIAPAKPTAIAISPVNPIVAVGKIVPLHVTAHLQDGSFLEVTNDVTWTVSPVTAATATGSQLKGLVAGDATVTAQYMGHYSSTDIDVTP